jgi:hypothetical protein
MSQRGVGMADVEEGETIAWITAACRAATVALPRGERGVEAAILWLQAFPAACRRGLGDVTDSAPGLFRLFVGAGLIPSCPSDSAMTGAIRLSRKGSVDERGERLTEDQIGETALQLGWGGLGVSASQSSEGEATRRDGQSPHRGELLGAGDPAQVGKDKGFSARILARVQGAPGRLGGGMNAGYLKGHREEHNRSVRPRRARLEEMDRHCTRAGRRR